MNKKTKVLLLALIVVLALIVLFGWQSVANENTTEQQQPAATQQEATEETKPQDVAYDGVEGQSALALLKSNYEVETITYEGIGEMVTSIDGVAASDSQFWSFYVNQQQAQVGASAYITKDTDKITWKLEEIQ